MNRRQFLKVAAAVVSQLGVSSRQASAAAAGDMQYRTLGHTGEKVSIVGLGGYHIGRPEVTQGESQRIIRTAIDNGVNFMDNCWDYHDGESEIRMGKALRDGYRQRVFLMTKLDGRDAKSAADQLDESLRRLQSDHLDLVQFHAVGKMDDPDKIFAPGGAFQSIVKARKAGKVRYIGFTGHKSPQVHLHMLDVAFRNNFVFDCVQMPLNSMDAHYESFTKLVVPVLVQHDIGVLGMKPLGNQAILHSGAVNARESLRYAMSLPTSVVITGCDSMAVLNQAIGVARSFSPMTDEERAALLARTAPLAQKGDFEPYKHWES